MKRSREDNGAPSQAKRPPTSRGESSGPTQPTSGSQRLTTNDALNYLKEVKDVFKDRKEKYAEFLEVMKDFKAQRINTNGVIAKVKELFKGHRNLILGFNTFLPKGYEITLPAQEEPAPKKQPVEFNQAINYVNKIKTRFQSNEQVYKAFLEILNMYRKGNKSMNEVYQEVAALFHDQLDLLEEFTYFLPDSTFPAPVAHAPGVKATAYSLFRRDEKIAGSTVSRMNHSEKIVKKERTFLSGDSEWSLDRPTEWEQEPIGKGEKDQPKKLEKEKDKKGEREYKERDKDDKHFEQQHGKNVEDMQRLPSKRKSARRADELIRKQSQAGEGGEAFVGSIAMGPLVEEKRAQKNLQREFVFFEKVKVKLGTDEAYQEFLKCLNLYSEEIIDRTQLQDLIDTILGRYPDLVEGFNEFFCFCENNEGYLANVVSKKFQIGEGTPMKAVKEEKRREKSREREKDKEREDGEREEIKEKEKERDISHRKDLSSHKVPSFSNKEKYMNKPISELDLSNCERCTPSYRLMPKNYPKATVSYRTNLGYSVLNDNWVSVTSGSEDYSFKHMRKNQYEESLFRCEDDRFELDMLLESTSAAAKRVEELLEKMHKADGKQESRVRYEDYLTAINLRCVERIYGDHGLDILDLLRKSPSVALPVILSRLKQKQEEWSKCKSDMNRVWADVYAKNYHKSLDHRSFYFKQQDKKNLSTKGLLVEIKEINEKNRKEDEAILSVTAGNRRSLTHDLKFEYPDSSINEDLYRIIKYSADELCTTMEQSDKIIRLWTSFLEPMFGVLSRSHGAEDTEEVATVKVLVQNDTTSSGGESDTSRDQNVAGVPNKGNDAGRDDCATTLNKDRQVMDRDGTITSIMNDQAVSYPKSTGGDARGEANSKEHFHPGLKSSDKRSNASRRENKVSYLKLESAHSKGCANEPLGNALQKIEREEGELSPSLDLEDWHTMDSSPATKDLLSVPEKLSSDRPKDSHMNNFNSCQEVAEGLQYNGHPHQDQNADDDGESAKKSEGSENVSEAGEEPCVSEPGDGDVDGSHEDNEEDDDDEEEPEGKAESEGEVEDVADVQDAEGDGTSWEYADRSLLMCKPLAVHGPSNVLHSMQDNDSTIFYGNDTFYVLFRLHQTLYERILSAKTNTAAAEQKWKTSKNTGRPDLYAKFMRALYNLLDGSSDNAKYEDDCRAIIGTQSYVLFTLDKLIFKLVKQLQAIVSDETATKLLALHSYEMSRTSSDFSDLVYHANACVLHDENIYRIEHRVSPNELFIQLVNDSSEKHEFSSNVMEFSFSNYLHSFLHTVPDIKDQHPLFLTRNKHRYMNEDEDDLWASIMRDVQVINGLEYKISCNTSKVSYVLDTEDFLHRVKRRKLSNLPGHKCRNDVIKRRTLQFREWVNTQLACSS